MTGWWSIGEMPRLASLRPSPAMVIALLALVLAMGGFAVAQSGRGSGGTIRGCADKKTGVLRVLKARGKCNRRERAISWQQQGPQGVAGSPGTAGRAGVP